MDEAPHKTLLLALPRPAPDSELLPKSLKQLLLPVGALGQAAPGNTPPGIAKMHLEPVFQRGANAAVAATCARSSTPRPFHGPHWRS